MKKLAFILALSCALVLAPVVAFATCADGTTLPNAACHTASACSSSQGVSFSGMCVAGSTSTTSTDKLRHCGGGPICAGGTPLGSGCTSDAACVSQFGSGFICVVDGDAGVSNCGTGFSSCIASCNDSTTTTTSTTSSTSTSTSS